jgi:RNA polymerase sigma-70 factor (ECF subfamily)
MTIADEVLLARYKQGDSHAFRELVERYSGPLYNLAYRILHDPMEAENVTQEAFLRIVASIERTRLDLPIKPYLFRIAVNLCYDVLRAKKPLTFTDLERDDESFSEIVEDAPEILDRMEKEELHLQLRAAIESLPPHYRTVIVLKYIEEFSYAEIAQTVNLPLNTVRTHLRRAKQQLRSRLERAWRSAVTQKTTLHLQAAEGD